VSFRPGRLSTHEHPALRKTIFFDLDGTLTDSRAGIIGSLHHALQQAGKPIPDDDLAWLIGPPIQQSLASLVGESAREEVFALYRQRYDEVGWRENMPYEGIHDMLAALAAKGYSLHVATAKPRVFAERILEHFDLRRFFDRVFGSELDGTRTQKDKLLQWAVSGMEVHEPATMVGDRRFDVEGAHANGMRSVGVTWGFGSRRELEAAGAQVIVDAPAALADLEF
jgi:phosphoglycolate phosphatase